MYSNWTFEEEEEDDDEELEEEEEEEEEEPEEEPEEKVEEEYTSFKNREIYENVSIEDLMNEKYKNSLIIYTEKPQ
jgi:hypothetical protein